MVIDADTDQVELLDVLIERAAQNETSAGDLVHDFFWRTKLEECLGLKAICLSAPKGTILRILANSQYLEIQEPGKRPVLVERPVMLRWPAPVLTAIPNC